MTEIGAGAFIGSDTALVAPVKIGDGAITAAGSVITKDVAADALAVARGAQIEKPGWAKAFRERRSQEIGEEVMCGIVGIAGTRDVAPIILEALKRLEYRGYDSAGIATLVDGADRAPPLARQAEQAGRGAGAEAAARPYRHRPYPLGDPWRADRSQCPSPCHARRSPSSITASSRISASCKAELTAKGHKFESETDSEVAAHLVTQLSGARAWRPTKPPSRRWRG